MSKRQREEDVLGNLGDNGDIWESIIFPQFYGEHSGFWMPLCLVSTLWLRMVCHVKQHVFTIKWDHVKKYRVLADRFGKKVETLKIVTHISLPLTSFTSLKVLHLVHIKSGCLTPKTFITLNVEPLVNLTTLKLGRLVCITGMNKLPKLTELSITSLEQHTPLAMFTQRLKTIKRLFIGKSRARDSVTRSVDLVHYYPLESPIEYLESDERDLFVGVAYTGIGRLNRVGFSKGAYYEGGWLNGMQDGRGVFIDMDMRRLEGVWKNNVIERGVILHGTTTYEGDVKICDSGRVYAHGYGKRTKDEYVHEGEFHYGEIHGQCTLYKNGKVVYGGKWHYGSFIEISQKRW